MVLQLNPLYLLLQEAKDGLQACYNSSVNPSTDPEEIKQRAMADPEVQVIVNIYFLIFNNVWNYVVLESQSG